MATAKMVDMTSAESVTKFLRSKTVSAEDVVSTTSILLDTKSLYLPNLHIFVFDLLCDRLNDFNSKSPFASWKQSSDLWRLFKTLWTFLLLHEKETRVKRLKLVPIIANIFLDLPTSVKPSDGSFLTDLFEAVSPVFKSGFVGIDENMSIGLLSSYLGYVSKYPNLNDTTLKSWTSTILDIFEIPFNRASYKPSSKITTKLLSQCLLDILIIVGGDFAGVSDTQRLESIASRFLKTADIVATTNSLLQNVSKQNQEEFRLPVVTLFKNVISIQSNNLAVVEDVFTSINKKFPGNISGDLFKEISKINKTLSPTFLQSVYQSELIDKQGSPSSINWDLVSYLIDLDSELASQNSSIIIQQSNQIKEKELFLNIASKIVDAYVRTRDLDRFLDTVWPGILESFPKSNIWYCPEFISIVAQNIDSLSTTQISEVVASLKTSKMKNNSDISSMLSAIASGLIQCPSSKQDSVKNIILDPELESTSSENFWQVRYSLLTLFGRDAVTPKAIIPEFNVKGSGASEHNEKMFHWTQLKMKEIGLEANDNTTPSYLNKNPNLILPFLSRWSLQYAKEPKKLSKVFLAMFDKVPVVEIIAFLREHSITVFELREFTKQLLLHLVEKIDSKKLDTFLPVILEIPIQAIAKQEKVKFINLTYKIAIKTKLSAINELAQKAILHLLKQPLFTSNLEVQFKDTLALVTSNPKNLDTSLGLFELILYNNFRQGNVTYIDEVKSYCSKRLSMEGKSSVLNIVYRIAFILLNSVKLRGDQLSDLKTQFVDSSTMLLRSLASNVSKNKEQINWIVNSVCQIQDWNNATSFTEIVMLIGEKITASTDKSLDDLRCTIYNFVCIDKGKLPTKLVALPLYFLLRTAYQVHSSSLRSSLTKYLIGLDNTLFESCHQLLLNTIDESLDNQNVECCMEILSCFFNSFASRDRDPSYTVLLCRSLSKVLEHTRDLSSNPLAWRTFYISLRKTLTECNWIFNQYSIELTMTLITSASTLHKEKPIDVYSYQLLTQIMSYILLFHRHRLSSRHHIVFTVFTSLLEPLTIKNNSLDNVLSKSEVAAYAYSRLLSNLCEPQTSPKSNQSNREVEVSYTSAKIKKSLRNHIHVLLVHYIYVTLKFNFLTIIIKEIEAGIFKVFDVLSTMELNLVNAQLDVAGRTYYRTLHQSYKDHGRWKDE